MEIKAKKKILIIEDSVDILHLTTHILKARGYDAIPLNSGRNAHELTLSHLPHLIILDMFLDDHLGLDICQAIKSDPLTAQIPIIMTTGDRSAENEAPPQKDKVPDDYLFKPFEIDELLEKIVKFLGPNA